MDGVKLLCLMLRDLQHLHGQNVKAILLELFDDVSDGLLLYGVGLNDSQCTLQCFHNLGLSALHYLYCRDAAWRVSPGSIDADKAWSTPALPKLRRASRQSRPEILQL